MNTDRKARVLIKLAKEETSLWDDAKALVSPGVDAVSEWWKNINPMGERQQKVRRGVLRKQLSDEESRKGLDKFRAAPRPVAGPLAWNKPAPKPAPKKVAPVSKAPPKLAPPVPGMEKHPADAASRALGLPAPSKVLKQKTFMDTGPKKTAPAASPASKFTQGKGQGYWHLAKQINKRYGFGGEGSGRKKVTSRELRGLMGGQMLHTRDYSFNKDQFLGKPAKGSLSGAGGLKGKKLQRAISSGAAFRKRRALAKKTPVAPKVQPPTKNQKSRMKANARILNEPAPHLRDLKAHIGGHNKNLTPGALAQARRNAMMNVGASRPLPPSKGPVRQGTKQDAADFLAAQSRFKKNQSGYHAELHGELDRVHSKSKKAPTTRVVKKDPHAGHDHAGHDH